MRRSKVPKPGEPAEPEWHRSSFSGSLPQTLASPKSQTGASAPKLGSLRNSSSHIGEASGRLRVESLLNEISSELRTVSDPQLGVALPESTHSPSQHSREASTTSSRSSPTAADSKAQDGQRQKFLQAPTFRDGNLLLDRIDRLRWTLELAFETTNLPKMDLVSKSDPFIVVKVGTASKGESAREEVFRTETVYDEQIHARFVSKLLLRNVNRTTIKETDYLLEVYDRDSKSEDLDQHDFIGTAQFSLCSLLLSSGHIQKMQLIGSAAEDSFKQKRLGTKRGQVIVHATGIPRESDWPGHLVFSVRPPKDISWTTWMFYTITREAREAYIPVYRSAYFPKDGGAAISSSISKAELTLGSLRTNLRIEISRRDSFVSQTCSTVGYAQFSLFDILQKRLDEFRLMWYPAPDSKGSELDLSVTASCSEEKHGVTQVMIDLKKT